MYQPVYNYNFNRPGNDFAIYYLVTRSTCYGRCFSTGTCVSFTFGVGGDCYLKYGRSNALVNFFYETVDFLCCEGK